MAEGHRDPEHVGYEWAAWWALQGDEPLTRVHECAVELQRELGKLSRRLGSTGDAEGSRVASAANLFMIAIAELLNDDGTSEFKADIKRRSRGKPINRHERALRGHRAAGIVIRLVESGWKQEAALAQATAETGLSRAEIMTWLAADRATLGLQGAKSTNNQD